MSFEACKETFENPQQPMYELCDALDASIVDCLVLILDLKPEQIEQVMFAIYDEFNHDPDIVE